MVRKRLLQGIVGMAAFVMAAVIQLVPRKITSIVMKTVTAMVHMDIFHQTILMLNYTMIILLC